MHTSVLTPHPLGGLTHYAVSLQMCGGANMNGALINPDDFQGRNPKDRREKCSPWQTLVGNEQVVNPWPGMPLGLNIRVPTPVRKGDLVRANMHYRST